MDGEQPLVIRVEQTVGGPEELQETNQKLNPIIRSILTGMQGAPGAQALPKHIKASFSLSA